MAIARTGKVGRILLQSTLRATTSEVHVLQYDRCASAAGSGNSQDRKEDVVTAKMEETWI